MPDEAAEVLPAQLQPVPPQLVDADAAAARDELCRHSFCKRTCRGISIIITIIIIIISSLLHEDRALLVKQVRADGGDIGLPLGVSHGGVARGLPAGQPGRVVVEVLGQIERVTGLRDGKEAQWDEALAQVAPARGHLHVLAHELRLDHVLAHFHDGLVGRSCCAADIVAALKNCPRRLRCRARGGLHCD